MARSLCLLALAALSLAGAPDALGQIWIVDRSGGAGSHFAEIQPAIDAATDGDLILVRPIESIFSYPLGYAGFVVDGKSLTISVDRSGDQVLVGQEFSWVPAAIVVRNVSAQQRFVLRGFTQKAGAAGDDGIRVESCDGPVLLEQSTFATHGGAAIHVADSASVFLAHCKTGDSTAYDDFADLGGLGYGLFAERSTVYAYTCTITGGSGAVMPFSAHPTDGAAGVVLDGGLAFLARCTVAGGWGGLSISGPGCEPGGDAGDGAIVQGGGALEAFVSTFSGGFLGSGCPQGAAGTPVLVLDGTYEPLSGVGHDLIFDSPVYGGGVLKGTLSGKPGEVSFLVISSSLSPLALPGIPGVLAPALPAIVASTGVIASGFVPISVAVPPLTGFAQLHVQSLCMDPSGAGPNFLGSPTVVLLVDSVLTPP